MLTFRTSVMDKNSFINKIYYNVIDKMRNPFEAKCIKRLSEYMKKIKKESFETLLGVDSYEVRKIDGIKFSDIIVVKKQAENSTEKFPKYKYVFEYNGDEHDVIDSYNKHIIYLIEDNAYGYITNDLNRWVCVDKQLHNEKYHYGITSHYKYLRNVIYDKNKFYEYKFLEMIVKIIRYLNPYKLLHMLDSIYLSVKYPFLYPRNRFTGKHYNYWPLLDKVSEIRKDAKMGIYAKYIPDNANVNLSVYPLVTETKSDNTVYLTFVDSNGKTVTLYKYDIITDSNGNESRKNAEYYPVRINDKWHVYDVENNDFINIHKYVKENDWVIPEGYDNSVHFYYTCTNRTKEFYARVLLFIHNIFELFHCIPMYNELDDMPEGWRRSFGMKMCDEIKRQLKEEKNLYKLRITQIKEKFGTLRFYVASASKEVYNIIDKYEDISYRTCISCGRPAKYLTTGWICPYCENCLSEENKLTARPIKKAIKENDSEIYEDDDIQC